MAPCSDPSDLAPFTRAELESLRRLGRDAACILNRLLSLAKPGSTTGELEQLFLHAAANVRARPAMLHYCGFPTGIAVARRNVVCRGIPRDDDILSAGELLGIDIALERDGVYVDLAATIPIGTVSSELHEIILKALDVLRLSIDAVQPWGPVSAVADACARAVSGTRFIIADGLNGHGIGRVLHCAPDIPHGGNSRSSCIFRPGTAIALEPVVLDVVTTVCLSADGWAIQPSVPAHSAFFEHTVLIGDGGPEVITLTADECSWEPPGGFRSL
jgi:methionyl aminopeptidase